MLKKILSLILIGLILNLAFYTTNVRANANEEKEAKFAAQVKSAVLKLGTGTEAKVQIKLKDGTKYKGYISEANQDNFTVVDAKMNKNTIPYSQVKQVKGRNNLTGDTIIVITGFVLAVLAVIALVSSD